MDLPVLLVDTNILLRIAGFEVHQDHALIESVRTHRHRSVLCVTVQNVAEFWNVATRPQKHNGLGRSIKEVNEKTNVIAERFRVLAETQETFDRWRVLVRDYEVTGVLVHDTRLAAIMLEYGISQILTLNPRDFARFPFIQTIDPREAN